MVRTTKHKYPRKQTRKSINHIPRSQYRRSTSNSRSNATKRRIRSATKSPNSGQWTSTKRRRKCKQNRVTRRRNSYMEDNARSKYTRKPPRSSVSTLSRRNRRRSRSASNCKRTKRNV